MPITLYLIDDWDMSRYSIRCLLKKNQNIQLIGCSPDEAIILSGLSATQSLPDVILLYAHHDAALVFIEQIRINAPTAKIIVVVGASVEKYLGTLLQLKVQGLIREQAHPRRWLDTVFAVARGQKYLDPSLVDLDRIHQVLQFSTRILTRRQLQVLQLLADGCSNKDIAELLTINLETVKSHVSAILIRLGVNTRIKAARLAWEGGLFMQPKR